MNTGGTHIYFYSAGGAWRMSASLPAGARIDAQRYHVVEMDADRPYIHHGDVERRYPPGQLKKQDKGKNKWK
jgi:hypothetical protein